jgi:TldD protein
MFAPMLTLALLTVARASDDPLLDALTTEIDRTMAGWEGEPDAPYFVGYRVDAGTWTNVYAVHGALSRSEENRSRTLDVSVRVGSHDLDNTHPIRGRSWEGSDRAGLSEALPLDGSDLALRTSIWRATADSVREAQERILRVRANRTVKVEEEDRSADFSVVEAQEAPMRACRSRRPPPRPTAWR